jgi:hypothetical protein
MFELRFVDKTHSFQHLFIKIFVLAPSKMTNQSGGNIILRVSKNDQTNESRCQSFCKGLLNLRTDLKAILFSKTFGLARITFYSNDGVGLLGYKLKVDWKRTKATVKRLVCYYRIHFKLRDRQFVN